MNSFWVDLVPELIIGFPLFVVGFFVGPAFGRINQGALAGSSRSIFQVMDEAQHSIDMTRSVAPRDRSPRTSQSSGDNAAAMLIACVVAVALYMKYQVPVLLFISALALVIAALTTVSIVRMSRTGHVTGSRGFAFTLLSLYLSSAVGIINISLLWNPPAGGEMFESFVSEYSVSGRFESFEGVIFVLYQLLGAVMYLFVAVFSIAFSLAILSAINLRIGTWGRPVWFQTFRFTSIVRRRSVVGVVVGFAAASILFSGGWIYALLDQTSPPAP